MFSILYVILFVEHAQYVPVLSKISWLQNKLTIISIKNVLLLELNEQV